MQYINEKIIAHESEYNAPTVRGMLHTLVMCKNFPKSTILFIVGLSNPNLIIFKITAKPKKNNMKQWHFLQQLLHRHWISKP